MLHNVFRFRLHACHDSERSPNAQSIVEGTRIVQALNEDTKLAQCYTLCDPQLFDVADLCQRTLEQSLNMLLRHLVRSQDSLPGPCCLLCL